MTTAGNGAGANGSAAVEVVQPGLGVTIQDLGRTGYRAIGVPVSGVLDPCLMAIANALAGNPPGAAVLEVRLKGPVLKVLAGPVRLSLAGELAGEITRGGHRAARVEPWQTVTLASGEVLALGTVAHGVACVGISGGVLVPPRLGSRSTYLRAAIGGIDGRAPEPGDSLPCGLVQGDPWREARGPRPWHHGDLAAPIRVIAGPQDDHFTAEALAAFFGTSYQVTREADRMGMRLEGERLAHSGLGSDIVSDGVAPGAIQVPANGQPIILLADCQTTGGYPKIASVIRADLARLAHCRPGDRLRFVAVDHAAARAALETQARALAQWLTGITSFLPPGRVDESLLLQENLVSGVISPHDLGF